MVSGELENEFIRFQKMRKKRNKFEYGNLESVSEAELKQAVMDANALLSKVEELIKKENSQTSLT